MSFYEENDSKNWGIEYEEYYVKNFNVNYESIYKMENTFMDEMNNKSCTIYKDLNYQTAWLLRAIKCIDLTTLSGDDVCLQVKALCQKALHPLPETVLKKLPLEKAIIKCGAVCVYPNMVSYCNAYVGDIIPVASVAAGFPAGLTPLSARIAEVKHAVEKGATEIDIVLDRSLVLMGKWKELYNEVKQLKRAVYSSIFIKVILSTGDLKDFNLISRAAMVSMMAGADFIKTSTGKESVNATISSTIIMLHAIRSYQMLCKYKVGFKPAGGLKTYQDALLYMRVIQSIMGPQFILSGRLRLGASSLLDSVVNRIEENLKNIELGE